MRIIDYFFKNLDWKDKIPKGEQTPPPLCMPDEYKCDDYVQAYRNYYMAEKRYFAAWGKGVPAPAWWLTQTNESPRVVV